MPVRVQLIGMEELRSYLRHLPDELVGEATDIVAGAAENAAAAIRTNYPIGPGSKKFPPGVLKSRVTVNAEHSRSRTFSRVSSRAPHAWIFEYGTFNRRTARGWFRGRMTTPSERGR